MDNKISPPAVPGVPAQKSNLQPLGSTPAANATPHAPVAAPLPVGSVDAIKQTVTAAGGNRGGRPRNDGLVPGSEEAKKRDLEKDADYQRTKRASATAARLSVRSVAPLPPSASAEGPVGAVPSPAAGVAGVPVVEPAEWLAADAAPLVESLVQAGEAWDDWDNRKIIAPLELDAASTSRILSRTRWPDKHKATVIKALPAPTAKLCNLIHLPKAVKDYIEGIPALGLLIQTIVENKRNLRQIVQEELSRKVPAPGAEKKP